MPISRITPSDRFDAAVVLGAKLRHDGSPSHALERRVARGVALVRDGQAEHLIMSGGLIAGTVPEAAVMAALAHAAGVPADRVLLEDRSTDTLENVLFSRDIVRAHGWRRIAVVTDDFHLPRALYTCRRLDLPATGVAATRPTLRPLWWAAALREVGALGVYLWRVERRRRNLRRSR